MSDAVKEQLKALLAELRSRWGYDGERRTALFARHLKVGRTTLHGWEKSGRISKVGLTLLAQAIQTTDKRVQAYLEGRITVVELLDEAGIQPEEPRKTLTSRLEQARQFISLSTNEELLVLLGDIFARVRSLLIEKADAEIARPQTIQQCILQELSKFDRPWSTSTAPLSVFADEALIEFDEVLSILGGRSPQPDELSRLSRVLTRDPQGQQYWTLTELMELVRQQYGHRKRKQSNGV